MKFAYKAGLNCPAGYCTLLMRNLTFFFWFRYFRMTNCVKPEYSIFSQVRCIYTKQWTYRQQGMDTIKRELTSEKPELIAERDSRSVIRAVVDLLKRGINEQVHPVRFVFKSFIENWNYRFVLNKIWCVIKCIK